MVLATASVNKEQSLRASKTAVLTLDRTVIAGQILPRILDDWMSVVDLVLDETDQTMAPLGSAEPEAGELASENDLVCSIFNMQCPAETAPVLYTVGHKKRGSKFSATTFANTDQFR